MKVFIQIDIKSHKIFMRYNKKQKHIILIGLKNQKRETVAKCTITF